MKNGNGNGSLAKREQKAAKLIEAIKESRGLLTLAANKTGMGYRTVCRYVVDFPSVKQAAADARETVTDLAEGKLYQAISAGNMTAIIFYLKTVGRHRGYVERQEVTGPGGSPVRYEIKVVDEFTKDLTERLCRGERPGSAPDPDTGIPTKP